MKTGKGGGRSDVDEGYISGMCALHSNMLSGTIKVCDISDCCKPFSSVCPSSPPKTSMKLCHLNVAHTWVAKSFALIYFSSFLASHQTKAFGACIIGMGC